MYAEKYFPFPYAMKSSTMFGVSVFILKTKKATMIFRAHLVPNDYSLVKNPRRKVTYIRNLNPSSTFHGKM